MIIHANGGVWLPTCATLTMGPSPHSDCDTQISRDYRRCCEFTGYYIRRLLDTFKDINGLLNSSVPYRSAQPRLSSIPHSALRVRRSGIEAELLFTSREVED